MRALLDKAKADAAEIGRTVDEMERETLADLKPNNEKKPTMMAEAAADLTQASISELKSALVKAAENFKAVQEEQWKAEDSAAEEEARSQQISERLTSPLAAEAFGNVELGLTSRLSELRNSTVSLIHSLNEASPPLDPLDGWRSKGRGSECLLDGTWKLLFTTGADATFRPKPGQTPPVAYQEIDAEQGFFVNCVDFPDDRSGGKLKGFRVVVAGYKCSKAPDEVLLKFRRVKLLRRSRLLSTIVVPLPPSWLLRTISRWASRGKGQTSPRGAGFRLLYLDDDLRCHVTFDGQYFVQKRIS